MKLGIDVNKVTTGNVGATGEFKIRNSAKAFKILSDGLYTNKIRAIIRELSCNAVDSHKAAGKEHIPFEVHLPSMMEPYFSVKDFGTGLSGDQVTNIYTTYFESTKADSNDFIGALGLGSKSPFSYTENFTVTAIKDGYKRIYSAYIDDATGVPSITEMSTELTDESSGVEVKFSVVDRYDYNSFQSEATNVFLWFRNKPKVTGATGFQHRSPDYKEENIVPGVHVLNTDRYGGGNSSVVMGNICYPLYGMSEPEKHFGPLAELLQCGIVIEVGIGEIDFAASREQLSIVPLTINTLKAKLELLNANLAAHIKEKVEEIPNMWDRAAFLHQRNRTKLFSAAVKKYVVDSKFPLADPNHYNLEKTFTFFPEDTRDKGIAIDGCYITSTKRGTALLGKSHEQHPVTKVRSEVSKITAQNGVAFILNDLKTGAMARVRYHYAQPNNGKDPAPTHIYVISADDKDIELRQPKYDAFLKEIHNPPKVFKASELLKKPVKPRLSGGTQGLMKLVKKRNDNSYSYNDYYAWQPVDAVDDTATYHFVCLNNFQPYDPNTNTNLNMISFKEKLDESGIKELQDIEIYGVRKNRIKDITPLDNWVWFEEIVKKEVGKITEKHITALLARTSHTSYANGAYGNKDVAARLDEKSPYAKHVKEISLLDTAAGEAKGDASILTDLCKTYGNIIKLDDITEGLRKSRNEIEARYPALRHLSSAPTSIMADYIKLVDR